MESAPMFFKINAYGQTDQGKERNKNEDAYHLDKNLHVYAVADGLGGLPEGDVASNLAIDTLKKYIEFRYGTKENKKSLPKGPLDFDWMFDRINQSVYEKSLEMSHEIGMGTTFTLVQIHDNNLHIGHMGDTGVYLFRDGCLKKLTKDHTLAQDILDSLRPDEPIPKIPDYFHHTLTRCLGHPTSCVVDTLTLALKKNDKVLLYSDGVTKTINDDYLLSLFSKIKTPKSLVNRIILKANKEGGPDNITAIVINIS